MHDLLRAHWAGVCAMYERCNRSLGIEGVENVERGQRIGERLGLRGGFNGWEKRGGMCGDGWRDGRGGGGCDGADVYER